jgi:hypothetical protein
MTTRSPLLSLSAVVVSPSLAGEAAIGTFFVASPKNNGGELISTA